MIWWLFDEWCVSAMKASKVLNMLIQFNTIQFFPHDDLNQIFLLCLSCSWRPRMSCNKNKQMPNMENHTSTPCHLGVTVQLQDAGRHSSRHPIVIKQQTGQIFWPDKSSDSRCSWTQSCSCFSSRIVSHIGPATPCLPPSHASHVWQPSDAVLRWDSRGRPRDGYFTHARLLDDGRRW